MPQRNVAFEWNPRKARLNLKKHGVSFEEAETLFDDPNARVIIGPDHSLEKDREIIIGQSHKNRLRSVSFAARANVIRIVSARKTDDREREPYEEKPDKDPQ